MDIPADQAEFLSRTFSGLDLSEASISNRSFDDCQFQDCNFNGALLEHCRFVDCVFESCNLSVCRLDRCRFSDVRFEGCKLVGIDWTTAQWPSIVLASPVGFRNCILNDSADRKNNVSFSYLPQACPAVQQRSMTCPSDP